MTLARGSVETEIFKTESKISFKWMKNDTELNIKPKNKHSLSEMLKN